jgi:solute:Na+ symporter, SSS family
VRGPAPRRCRVSAQESALGGAFSGLDWAVVAGVFLATSLIGVFAGKRATIREFFLGGRKLSWWAVALSIVATEISALTLVSLPSVVFKPHGNFNYLQITVIGSILARLAVAWWLVPAYYEREIYSPYEYMEAHLGRSVGAMATFFFALGGVLAQSARVYVTAVVLDVILHDELARMSAASGVPSLAIAVGMIGVLAIAWTYAGGISTVVWTDVVLFVAFVAAAIVALIVIAQNLDTGFARIWQVGVDAHKIDFFDFSANPAKAYTFWAAAIASSWGGVGAYGIDQLMAQRIFCCRDAREARKAVLASSIAVVVTVLVSFIGVGLFAYYERNPLAGGALALYEKQADTIFPVFILTVVPNGWRGLIVAGILAAAISTLTGIIAALSQAAYSTLYVPWRDRGRSASGAISPPAAAVSSGRRTEPELAPDERKSVLVSRLFVLASGVVLCAMALAMERASHRYGSLLDLGLAMAGYTQGALIAGFALAFLRMRVDGSGFLWSAPLSLTAVFAAAWHGLRSEWICLGFSGAFFAAWVLLRTLPDALRGASAVRILGQVASVALALGLLVWTNRFGLFPVLRNPHHDPEYDWLPLSFPWYVPIGSTVAFVFGVLLARPNASPCSTEVRDARAPALE